MPPRPPPATNSGIRQLSTGESVIPSSTRADGSVRKEIRVKPGYKPPEDVEVYKNRSVEAWKNRGRGGVPGAEPVGTEEAGKAAAKNAKRKEARKKAAVAAAEGKDEGAEGEVNGTGVDANVVVEEIDPEVERVKEARKLTKKLRQAKELQERKEKGDSLLPEQFAKVIKINELNRQLDNLGFDAEGEKISPEKEDEGV